MIVYFLKTFHIINLSKVSIVDAYKKKRFIEQLAKNTEILAEICEELDLEIPEDEEVDNPPNPQATNINSPQFVTVNNNTDNAVNTNASANPNPNNTSTQQNHTTSTANPAPDAPEKPHELPGITKSSQIPLWVYLLIALAIYLYLSKENNQLANNNSNAKPQ